jgi:hypothetical protein
MPTKEAQVAHIIFGPLIVQVHFFLSHLLAHHLYLAFEVLFQTDAHF